MRHSTETRRQATTIGRWALPAAFLLALATTTSAHGTQAPADNGAEFDPGAVCATSVAAPSASTDGLQLSRLVIGAHAASVHASR